MTGFEPRASSIGSDRSANWTTTTALLLIFIVTVSSVDVILLIMNVLCKISWWLDSKTNPLVSKVTTLPSVPHPLAIKFSFFISGPSLTIAVGSLMEDQLVGNVCFVTNGIYVVIVLQNHLRGFLKNLDGRLNDRIFMHSKLIFQFRVFT